MLVGTGTGVGVLVGGCNVGVGVGSGVFVGGRGVGVNVVVAVGTGVLVAVGTGVLVGVLVAVGEITRSYGTSMTTYTETPNSAPPLVPRRQ